MEFKLLIMLILTIAVPCDILVLKGPKRSLFELWTGNNGIGVCY